MNKKGSIQLGYNIKRALILGLIFGMGSVLVYLFVVVITTPALSPAAAISAVFQINSIIVIGMGIGVGLQMFLSTFSRGLGCRLDVKRRVSVGNSGGAAMTGFFSFFSLIPLGCCGTWLYILSLLPSVLGTGISAGLIAYSQALAYIGITIIFGFNGITIYKLRKEVARTRILGWT